MRFLEILQLTDTRNFLVLRNHFKFMFRKNTSFSYLNNYALCSMMDSLRSGKKLSHEIFL